MSKSLLNKPLSAVEFVALDLETTGFDPGKAEIIEIAAIRFNQKGELSRFNALVKPRKGINFQAMQVNGITEADLQNAGQLDSIYNNFLNFIDNSILVIQNAEFDLGFLLYEARIRNIPFPTLPIFCTVQLTRKLFPDIRHNLTSLRKEFGIKSSKKRSSSEGQIHEALDDSYATMEVLKKCIQNQNAWDKKFYDLVFHEKGFKLSSDFDEQKLFT